MTGALANDAIVSADEKPEVLDAKVSATIKVPTEAVALIAVSADAKSVVTMRGFSKRTVELWDATTGKSKGGLSKESQPAITAIFTLDGKTLITGGDDGNVCVWDVATRKLRKRFKAAVGIISAIAVSGDATIVYVGENEHAPGLWNVTSGARIGTDQAAEGRPRAFDFALTSKLLVSTSELLAAASADFQLWDGENGKNLKGIPFKGKTPLTVRFSPDGKRFAVGSLLGVHLVDVATGNVTTLDPVQGYPAVAFAGDGRTLIASSDAEINTWDIETGKKSSALKVKRDAAGVVAAFSGDGSVLVAPATSKTLDVYTIHLADGKK